MEWFCSLVQSKSPRLASVLLWAFLSKVTMLVMMGANSPSILRKPLRNAAAVFMHLPSSDE